MTNYIRLEKGDRIYNAGDMANPSHFGVVEEVKNDRWGIQYKIKPDIYPNEDHKPYWIDSVMVSKTYSGNGSTRIVTEAEYERWREEKLEAFKRGSHAGKT